MKKMNLMKGMKSQAISAGLIAIVMIQAVAVVSTIIASLGRRQGVTHISVADSGDTPKHRI